MDSTVDILLWFLDCFDASVTRAAELLSYSLSSEKLADATEMARKLNSDVIVPLALQICAICFLIQFLKIVNLQDFTRIETYIKIFFLVSLSKSALNYSFTICEAIYDKCADVIKDAADIFTKQETLGMSETYGKSLKEALQGLGVLEWIVFFFLGIIFIICIVVTIIMISFIAWGRYFELFLLMSGAALPMAFIPLGSEGGRMVKTYLMHFASVCLQGFVIIACFGICRAFTNSALFLAAETGNATVSGVITALSALGSVAIIGLLLVFSLFKSQQFAQKYLGQ